MSRARNSRIIWITVLCGLGSLLTGFVLHQNSVEESEYFYGEIEKIPAGIHGGQYTNSGFHAVQLLRWEDDGTIENAISSGEVSRADSAEAMQNARHEFDLIARSNGFTDAVREEMLAESLGTIWTWASVITVFFFASSIAALIRRRRLPQESAPTVDLPPQNDDLDTQVMSLMGDTKAPDNAELAPDPNFANLDVPAVQGVRFSDEHRPSGAAVGGPLLGLAALMVTFSWASGNPEVLALTGTLAVVFCALAIFALFGAAVGRAASRKGRSYVAFFWLSILLNPLLTGVIVATLSPVPANLIPGNAELMRACPRCAEDIKVEANLCKHCGSDV